MAAYNSFHQRLYWIEDFFGVAVPEWATLSQRCLAAEQSVSSAQLGQPISPRSTPPENDAQLGARLAILFSSLTQRIPRLHLDLDWVGDPATGLGNLDALEIPHLTVTSSSHIQLAIVRRLAQLTAQAGCQPPEIAGQNITRKEVCQWAKRLDSLYADAAMGGYGPAKGAVDYLCGICHSHGKVTKLPSPAARVEHIRSDHGN